jgi:hypothetical protein
MADVIVKKSEIHGLGVFASRDFEPGEKILAIDDTRVVDAEHPLRPELGEFGHHCDHLADNQVVLMQYPERYINSSCSPNVYVKTISGARHVIALKSIEQGDELTYDYIINCHGGELWQCNCGSCNCRGTIVSSYFELPLKLQIEYLPLLDDWFIEEHSGKIERLRSMVDAPLTGDDP